MKKSGTGMALLIILGILSFMSCSIENDHESTPIVLKNIDSISFSHSMKGWELYSWPNGEVWYFSILVGTNRMKMLDEVTKNKIIVQGKDSFKLLLNKFPANEEIFWAGQGWLNTTWGSGYGNLALPNNATISEIMDYCNQRGLILTVLK